LSPARCENLLGLLGNLDLWVCGIVPYIFARMRLEPLSGCVLLGGLPRLGDTSPGRAALGSAKPRILKGEIP
jgi:hypothetical protein